MKREDVEQRLTSLHAGKSTIQDEIDYHTAILEQKKSDLLLTTGAIKDCEHWLQVESVTSIEKVKKGEIK